MIRDSVREVLTHERLPSSDEAIADPSRLGNLQAAIEAIDPPVSDDEARALLGMLGDDECFGLAWALVHLIETAPSWPDWDALHVAPGEWPAFLEARAERGASPE